MGFNKTYSDRDILKSISFANITICFDTNVLLNLYECSDDSRDLWFESVAPIALSVMLPSREIREFRLPHQAVQEFNQRRIEVIRGQINKCNEEIKKVKDLKNELINNKADYKNLYSDEEHDKSMNEHIEKRKNKINERKKKFVKYITKEDEILNRLSEVFENRISSSYTYEQQEEIFKEGEIRYAQRIPPGFGDDYKPEEKTRKFGDLLIWKQLLDIAKESAKDMLFVTDDINKEDWVFKYESKILCTRPELVEEFYRFTGCKIFIISLDEYFKYGLEKSDQAIRAECEAKIDRLYRNMEPLVGSIKILEDRLDTQLRIIKGELDPGGDRLEKRERIIGAYFIREEIEKELAGLVERIEKDKNQVTELEERIRAIEGKTTQKQ